MTIQHFYDERTGTLTLRGGIMRGESMRPTRPLLLVVLALLGVFLFSIALRQPWRGHLAKGDSWTTAQTLRFLRTWHRDGLWESRVVTRPTRPAEAADPVGGRSVAGSPRTGALARRPQGQKGARGGRSSQSPDGD